MPQKVKEKLKLVGLYLLVTLFTLVLLKTLNGYLLNPFSNYILNNYSESTNGKLISTSQDYESNEAGDHESYNYEWEFIYRGENYENSASSMGVLSDEYFNIEKPVPIKIEFWPIYPDINRIKGEGVTELWGMIVTGIIYLSINGFIIGYLFIGWKDLSKKNRDRKL